MYKQLAGKIKGSDSEKNVIINIDNLALCREHLHLFVILVHVHMRTHNMMSFF